MVVQQTQTSSSATATASAASGELQQSPQTSFQRFMRAIAAVRDKVGLSPELFDTERWAESKLLAPVVRGMEWVKGSPIRRGVLIPLALGIVFGVNPEIYREYTAGGGPWLDRMEQANAVLSANPVGNYILTLIQTVSQFPTVIESNPLVKPENNAFLNAALGLGGVAQMFAIAYALSAFVQLVISRATRRAAQEQAREERMMRGEEPLPADKDPSVVILGNVEALHAYLGCHGEKASTGSPRVLVFPERDQSRIQDLPNDTKRNWRVAISGNNALLDPEVRSKAGMDRAPEIVVFAIDPKQVAFSGNSSKGYFSASDCLALLAQLANQARVPAKIKLVIPSDASVGAAPSFRQACGPESAIGKALREKGATVDVVHPEALVLEMIREKVKEMKDPLARDHEFSICLVGDGNEITLGRLEKAIRQNVYEVAKVNTCHFLQDRDANEGSPTKRPARRERRRNSGNDRQFPKKADLVIVYGEDDNSTFALASTLEEGVKRLALVETPVGSNLFAVSDIRHHCIHTHINRKLGLTTGIAQAQAV